MRIYRKEFDLYKETYKGETDYIAFEKLRLIHTFLNSYSNLTDEMFLKIILAFYNVSLEEEDYLKIINRITGEEFTKFESIKTNMTYTHMCTEGRGHDFSYWNENVRMGLIVAVKDNFNKKKSYSREEILNLQKSRELYPLSSFSETYCKTNFKKEAWEYFPVLKDTLFIPELLDRYYEDDLDAINVNSKYIDIIVELLREKVSINDIFSTMKKFVKNLLENVYDLIFYNEDFHCPGGYSELDKKLTEYYDANFKNVRKLEKR